MQEAISISLSSKVLRFSDIRKGPYGDRLMTSSKYIWGHSHNIFLEILVSFGFLLGVPILLLLLNTLFALMSKKTSF